MPPQYAISSNSTSAWVYTTDITRPSEMSITKQVVKQRQDEKERIRVNEALDAYLEAWPEPFEDGAVIAWSKHVAVYNDEYWSSTMHSGPKGDTEDLIIWLIEHKIEVGDVTTLR